MTKETASVQLTKLDQETHELIQAAIDTINRHFEVKKHHVACAIKSSKGMIYPGIHLDCAGFDNCAEPIAIANACMAGDNELTLAVAVAKDSRTQAIEVINPCGNCLQHFLVFAPTIDIVAQTKEGIRRLPLREIFPYPYEN